MTFSPTVQESPRCPHPHQSLILSGFFYFNHLRVCVGISLFCFVFPRWLRLNNFEVYLDILFHDVPLNISCLFLYSVFFFIALYVLGKNPWSDLCATNIFSRSGLCLLLFVCVFVFVLFHCSFILLLTSSDEWKFFNVTQFVRVSLYG